MHEFREYLIGQGLTDSTIRLYVRYASMADQWMRHHHTSLEWASPSLVAEFTSTHVAFSHSSRGQCAAAFRHYWTFRGRADGPVKAVRVPAQPEMVCRAIEEEDARALVKTALGWWPEGTAVLFGLYLALRRTEIARAEWSRFSREMAWYTVTGKRDKTATLPVHPILVGDLEGRRERSGWVFEGRFGSHVSPATIWSWTKRVATEAGLDDFTTHQLRHTALTTANDGLGDLRAVQTFARHSRPSTTAGYTRTKMNRLVEVSDSLDYL